MTAIPTCIPNPCDLFPTSSTECNDFWCLNKDDYIPFNSVYSLGYVTNVIIPIILDKVPTTIQNNFSEWLFKVAIIQTAPYTAMFIIIFIILMKTNILSSDTGLCLIILAIVFALITIFYMLQETENLVATTILGIHDRLVANWQLYGTDITDAILLAAFDPDGIQCYQCNSSSDLSSDLTLETNKNKFAKAINFSQRRIGIENIIAKYNQQNSLL